jgi:O-antigen/teichoic acid export membrane protein
VGVKSSIDMNSLVNKARKSALFVIPGQAVTKILTFAYVVLLARFLSVNDYGVYNFIVGTLMILSYPCNFGVASSIQRFLPEYERLDLSGRSLRTMIFAHAFRLVSSIVVLVAAVTMFDYWAHLFHMESRAREFTIFALGAFFLYQIEYFEIEFEALFLHPVTSSVRVLYTIVKVVTAYIALRFGLAVTGVLSAEAVSAVAGFLALLWIFLTRIYWPRRSQISAGGGLELRRIGRYSGINALVIPGNILYSHSMDYFVIAALANPYDLGLYALASRASRMLMSVMPQKVLQGVIRPAFYTSFCSASDRRVELNRMFQMVVNMAAASLLPTLCLVGITAKQVIEVFFGLRYTGAAPVFIIFLLFNVFLVLELSSDLVLQAIERVEARFYGQVFALYNIVGAVVLMRPFGVAGVAFATGSAQAMRALFYHYMARKHARISVDFYPLLKIGMNSAVASLASLAMPAIGGPTFQLITSISVGIGTYLGMSVFNNFMNSTEKRLFNDLCRKQVFSV